jgi:hypothetical protein
MMHLKVHHYSFKFIDKAVKFKFFFISFLLVFFMSEQIKIKRETNHTNNSQTKSSQPDRPKFHRVSSDPNLRNRNIEPRDPNCCFARTFCCCLN